MVETKDVDGWRGSHRPPIWLGGLEQRIVVAGQDHNATAGVRQQPASLLEEGQRITDVLEGVANQQDDVGFGFRGAREHAAELQEAILQVSAQMQVRAVRQRYHCG